jgi:5'-3' exoribonuclease 1
VHRFKSYALISPSRLWQALMEAKARGEEVPAQPFDSNCITPGTEFMASLTQFLYYYIR